MQYSATSSVRSVSYHISSPCLTVLVSVLGAGKVKAAQTLLAMLPPELGALEHSLEESAEHYHYLQFFAIWQALDRVNESQATEASYTSRGVRNTWLNTFKVRLLVIDLEISARIHWIICLAPR